MTGFFALLRLFFLILLGIALARLARRFFAAGKLTSSKPKQAAPANLVQCGVCKDFVPEQQTHCGKAGCPYPLQCVAGWLFWLFLLLPGMAQAENGGRYLIELSGRNVSVALTVNNIPAERWTFTAEEDAGVSLNHWLKQGNNSFRITASPQVGGRASTLKLRIYFLSVGTGRETTLLELDDLDKAQKGVSVNFNLPSAPALALWQTTAGVLSVEQAASLAGRLRTEMIEAAGTGRNIVDIDALALERADMARAFGMPATSGPLAQTAQNTQDKTEVSRAPAVPDLKVEPVAGTALMRVSRRDGAPLVALRQGQLVAVVTSIIAGQVDGRWQIIRRAD